jgi:hypothetical protein
MFSTSSSRQKHKRKKIKTDKNNFIEVRVPRHTSGIRSVKEERKPRA